ncbi:hypothetical protein SGLAM104S_07347 [Streptomyces glaucescens]
MSRIVACRCYSASISGQGPRGTRHVPKRRSPPVPCGRRAAFRLFDSPRRRSHSMPHGYSFAREYARSACWGDGVSTKLCCKGFTFRDPCSGRCSGHAENGYDRGPHGARASVSIGSDGVSGAGVRDMGALPGRGHRTGPRRRAPGAAAARGRAGARRRRRTVAAARGLGRRGGRRRGPVDAAAARRCLACVRHGRGQHRPARPRRTPAARPAGAPGDRRRMGGSAAQRIRPRVRRGRVPVRDAVLAGTAAHPQRGADARGVGMRDAGRPGTRHRRDHDRADRRGHPSGGRGHHPEPGPPAGPSAECAGRGLLGHVRGGQRRVRRDRLGGRRPARGDDSGPGDPGRGRPHAGAGGGGRLGGGPVDRRAVVGPGSAAPGRVGPGAGDAASSGVGSPVGGDAVPSGGKGAAARRAVGSGSEGPAVCGGGDAQRGL